MLSHTKADSECRRMDISRVWHALL